MGSRFETRALLSRSTEEQKPVQSIMSAKWGQARHATEGKRYLEEDARFGLASACLTTIHPASRGTTHESLPTWHKA